MAFPDAWEMDSPQLGQIPDEDTQASLPKEGLFDVSPESAEFWDVHEELRKPPKPKNARPCEVTGQSSDVRGMHDAWITKLQRIQNSDLYAYYDTQLRRVSKSTGACDDSTGAVKQTRGWHGTRGFPAANIYTDRQDGCKSIRHPNIMPVDSCHTNCGHAMQS